MKSIAEVLAEQPIFAGIEPEWLELMAGCSINVHFRPDERIIAFDDPADLFYIVRTGRVALEVHRPGRGDLIVETIGPGEVLGVSWLLPPYRWAFDARALDEVGAVAIDAACLRGKCDDDPRLGYSLYRRFAGVIRDRLTAARLQLLDVYSSHGS